MTEKVILVIHRSDGYTDYLLQTVALTNRRVVPMIDPSPEAYSREYFPGVTVFHCFNTRDGESVDGEPVRFDDESGVVRVHSRYYLGDDGGVDPRKAEYVRALIEEAVNDRLLGDGNLRELYRRYFPLLWKNRERICSDPRFFFVRSGWQGIGFDCYPVGVILRTIENERKYFRLSLRGGCHCAEPPLLIDFSYCFDGGEHIMLHTWCPVCGERRVFMTDRFGREGYCNGALESACRHYDKDQGDSPLGLFDLIDALRSA